MKKTDAFYTSNNVFISSNISILYTLKRSPSGLCFKIILEQ